MSAVEAGEDAVRATRFHNESDSWIPGAIGRPFAKLLDDGCLGKQEPNSAAANDLLERHPPVTRRTATRPAIAAFVVTCLPLPRDVFDKLKGEQGALAGMPDRSRRYIPIDSRNRFEIPRPAAAVCVHFAASAWDSHAQQYTTTAHG
ncbi:hypothetical protein NKI59_21865 [Mesorhizobium sp. M0598]|uniref:hypothetical protein n=1 Tax=Mesorhizobium sp. M0598 TaxID=2956968 RepID=UPI00333DD082